MVSKRRLLLTVVIVAAVAMVWWILLVDPYDCKVECEPESTGWRSLPGFLAVLLSMAPILVLVASEAGLWRSRRLFENLPDAVQRTALFERAGLLIARRSYVPMRMTAPGREAPESTEQVLQRGGLFWFAMMLVTLVMFLSWNFIMNAPLGRGRYVDPMVPFLRGLVMPDHMEDARRFASLTLTINGVGFTVAYVVVLYRMYVRLNTAALSAIETLNDVMHLMAAIMVATVGRVALAAWGFGDAVGVSFAIAAGVRPTLALDWLVTLAWQQLRKLLASGPVDRRAPTGDEIPIEVPLNMLDGFGDRRGEVIDRLEGLDIATCQRLAFHNPLLIWVRSPYLLPEIMDWCGQAMLAVVLPTKFAALRGCGVRTVFDLLSWLDTAYVPVLAALGITAGEATTLAAGLRRCAQVRDLEKLAAAL